MAKLEQLSELLVSEISQFEKTVEKLEKIQQEKLAIDSNSLEYAIMQQQEKIEKALDSHSREMNSLGHKLEKAKAYPAWALTLFTASLILNGILVYIIFF
ncbi:DUF6730 family protein [Zunongwangia pacifica]|uniref:Uncharacterized protein n=1 Tax=Zunongwangia pacifica TaxID=2911062 RepID=A0A9X2CK31_9FLAO|nr:DUF6730 family protein [Zunongwangia pacifica]MCL6217035.1 hypothetical protein [Zunongwangia pacifica]